MRTIWPPKFMEHKYACNNCNQIKFNYLSVITILCMAITEAQQYVPTRTIYANVNPVQQLASAAVGCTQPLRPWQANVPPPQALAALPPSQNFFQIQDQWRRPLLSQQKQWQPPRSHNNRVIITSSATAYASMPYDKQPPPVRTHQDVQARPAYIAQLHGPLQVSQRSVAQPSVLVQHAAPVGSNKNNQIGIATPDQLYARTVNASGALTRPTAPAWAVQRQSELPPSVKSLQNPNLLGGDILLRFGRRRPAARGRVYKYERSALVSPIQLWPNGLIHFELDPSVDHLAELIYKVMQQFHDETCIRFIERESNEPDYLRIEALKGCFSYIGRIGGEQTLSLGDGCEYRGTIAHELLHTVGFYHHQNRSDRDEFLEIVWDNIAKGKESQFLKMAPHDNLLLNEFDYNSIMLYGPHTFAKTLGKVTMKPKREGVILLEVIKKQGLSALDIDSVNKLYKCQPTYMNH